MILTLFIPSKERPSVRNKSCLSDNFKITEANLMKLKHKEKSCRAQVLSLYAQGQGHIRVEGQIVP